MQKDFRKIFYLLFWLSNYLLDANNSPIQLKKGVIQWIKSAFLRFFYFTDELLIYLLMNKLKKLVDWIINNFENKNIKRKGKIIQYY